MKINVFIKCRVLPPLFSWLYKNEYRMPAKMPKNAFPLTSAIKDIFQSTSWEDPAGRLVGPRLSLGTRMHVNTDHGFLKASEAE